MALPTQLQIIRAKLSAKTNRSLNETNLLRELNAINDLVLLESVRKIESNEQRMTAPDAFCPCCGR
jgi:hypothetical protein